jgi:GNAT superfamily N-acetyltransferase
MELLARACAVFPIHCFFFTSIASSLTMFEIKKVDESLLDDAISLIEEYYDSINIVVRDDRETILHYALDKDSSGIWLSYAGDTPVGCVLLRPLPCVSSTAVEVKRLYVKENFRGKGVPHELMKALEACAKELGNDWIYLDTKDDLLAAIKFYQNFGYEKCDRYNDNPQATIFMRKKL